MTQSDMALGSGLSGSGFRSELNTHLESVTTCFAGASAPSVTFPDMWWVDTTATLLKQRNNANTTWITRGDLASKFLQTGDDGAVLLNILAQGKQTAPIPAAAMAPRSTGGCAALARTAGASNQPDIVGLDFVDGSQTYAEFELYMPKSWDKGTLSFHPIWTPTTAAAGDVVWGLQAVAVSDNETIAVNYGSAQTVTDTCTASTALVRVGPESAAITIAGTPADGDKVHFRIFRDGGAGGDTLATGARLHGIRLFYGVNLKNDA